MVPEHLVFFNDIEVSRWELNNISSITVALEISDNILYGPVLTVNQNMFTEVEVANE